jgi:predicted dehydrogenase
MDQTSNLSRRGVLLGSTFMIIRPELVRGAGKERLKVGLVGCGARGTQAVENLLTADENVEIIALADLFEDHLEKSLRTLREEPRNAGLRDRVRVDPEHRFIGFDAFHKVLATDIDIVMLCTPPAYRPMHFEAAIEAGKHIFAEKPFGTDPTGVRRIMAAAQKAKERKLTVLSGAHKRWALRYLESVPRLKDGSMGTILSVEAYFLSTPVIPVKERDPKWGDMEWQHRNWYAFLWICGDQIVEQHFHNIDVVNWVMGTHPVKAIASGGAAWRPRTELYGNIYDHISAEFVYPNGVRLSSKCRQYPRGLANWRGETVITSKGPTSWDDMKAWTKNPYVLEHTALVKSVRGDGPYINQGQEIAESTLSCIMGREAGYSGQEITWDKIMNSRQDLFPKQFGYDVKMDVPPLPVPGVYQFA